jgi:predicted SprT family Zn-dependent metalloprotease
MNVKDAQGRAAAMVASQEHLGHWRVVIDRRPRKRMGQTRYTKCEIGLTLAYVELNGWDIISQVVLHEMAHALVGPGNGHGPVWKRKARELGLRNPRAAMSDPELKGPARPELPVAVTCPRHGLIMRKARMPKAGARYRHTCGEVVTFARDLVH